MALRTAGQYLESLRDKRVVYYAGQRVDDVTAHPQLGLHARETARQYGDGENEPADRLALRTITLADGERVHRWTVPSRTKEDLHRFVEMEASMEGDEHGAVLAGLCSLQILSRRMDAKHGTEYSERIDRYLDWFARTDVHAAFAMTDAKGDRSKGPSGQVDPDLFLRVVERRADGIVIRGCKTSVTSGALCNELLVMPTHFMREDDKDWAVACAVPADAPGVVFVSNYVGGAWGEQFRFDRPLSHSYHHHDATGFFNDVFVPTDRVFMDGEHEFTGEFLKYFTSLHRTRILKMEPRDTRKLIGAAQLIARYNGLEHVGGIKDRITGMVQTAVLLDTLRYAGLNKVEFVEGFCVPDAAACNLAGLTVTDTREDYINFLLELCGGPVLTAPSGLDLANPETGELIRKYYVGKPGVSAEDRLALVKYVYDIGASDFAGWNRALGFTGAGSPGARRIAATRGYDIETCVEEVLEQINGAHGYYSH